MTKLTTIRTTALIALLAFAVALTACTQPASPTPSPTAVPPTSVPATPVPATTVPATSVPPTPVPATAVPATVAPAAATKPAETVPPATAVPTAPAKAAAALTLDMLQNAEYASEFTASKKAKLVAGKYEEAIAPGSASKVLVNLIPQPLAFGDLNGDGVDDAAVLLATNAGGSGTFIVLNVVLNDNGTAKFASSIALGDRVQPKSITLTGGVITVEEIRHAPSDPLCCPTQQATLKFKLVDGKLVEIK